MGKRQVCKSVNHMLYRITGTYVGWEEPPELKTCSLPTGIQKRLIILNKPVEQDHYQEPRNLGANSFYKKRIKACSSPHSQNLTTE